MSALKDMWDERCSLEEEIKKIESEGNSTSKIELPTVKLDTVSYDPPSDEQLAKAAEDSLQAYKADGIAAIKQNSTDEAQALAQKRDGYSEKLSGEKAELDQLYETAAQRVDNDVLKRGLARSSVAVNSKSALETDYAQKAAELNQIYGKQIADIDAQIADTDNKLKAALNDFNISYAVKLNEKLAELKNERNEKALEALKYNNEIKVKQATLDANKAKTESSLNSSNSITQEQQEAIYKAVYDRINQYLASLDAEDARFEIRNHSLYRSHLSDFYYYKLYDKYGR